MTFRRRYNPGFKRSRSDYRGVGIETLTGKLDDVAKEEYVTSGIMEVIQIPSKVKIVMREEEASDESLPSTAEEDIEKINKAKETLTEDQKEIFDQLLTFVNTPIIKLNDKLDNKYYVLEGYAGTGKTYLLSKFLSIITSDIAVSAPTNKAVKVLADNKNLNEGEAEVVYNTIHKFLALKLTWVAPSGKYDLPRQVLTRTTFNEPTINNYSLLIIDEASMLNEELFNLIHNETKDSLKIIFVGDPAQIPPVNEIDSVPLLPNGRKEYNMKYGTLKKIMRQKEGSDILVIASAIRDGRFRDVDSISSYRKSLVESSQVIFYPSLDYPIFVDEINKHFDSEKFQADANYSKVIAWTNETVNAYNLLIRKKIFKKENLRKLEIGERLIADTTIFSNDMGTKQIIFNTSDEFIVKGHQMQSHTIFFPGRIKQENLGFYDIGDTPVIKYYQTLVITSDGIEKVIKVVSEESEDVYQSAIKRMAAIARASKIWASYYELIETFAKVKYNYAITAHKAQGSTYNHVFLVQDDIDPNPRYVERNRILYTACTRPKDTLHILSSKNKVRREIK